MTLSLFLQCTQAVGSLMILLWLYSLARRDVSTVDPWWSMSFLLVCTVIMRQQAFCLSKVLLYLLVVLWATRLWLYLIVRSRGKPEDKRYAAFREKHGPERYWLISLFQVFGLQGTLVLFISMPLQMALTNPVPDPLTPLDLLGTLLVFTGICIETIADLQMADFKRDPRNRGKVMDKGLWGWSRHPNYFGDAVLWWGFWLFALDTTWGPLSIVSPLLMTYLLLRVSGVTMLESQLKDTKPKYADYIRKTSAFVPWPPKKVSS